MNKQEWCAARFTSELPDCLPLPELREVPGCEWATYALSMAKDPDTETLASATLLLLGVYGGINEAGLSVWNSTRPASQSGTGFHTSPCGRNGSLTGRRPN